MEIETEEGGTGWAESERQTETYRHASRRSRELQTCTVHRFPRDRNWGTAEGGHGRWAPQGTHLVAVWGPQEHSPSPCYPHDTPQPADLGLRGRPGKSSLRSHPSRAPARHLSHRVLHPTSLQRLTGNLGPSVQPLPRASRFQGPAAGSRERTGRVPPACWSASGVAGRHRYRRLQTPIGGVPSCLPWDWLEMDTLYFYPPSQDPGRRKPAPLGVFDWFIS